MNGDNKAYRESIRDDEEAQRFAENRSPSITSRKSEQALFDDLEKLKYEYESHYYQSELRRFETHVNMPQGTMNKSLDGPPSTLLTRTHTIKTQVSKKKTQKQSSTQFITPIAKIKISMAERNIRKRKACRFISFFGCIFFTVAVSLFLYFLGHKTFYQEVNWNGKTVNLSLQNCRLFLESCTSCPEQSMQLDYRSSISTIFNKVISGDNTFVSHISGSNMNFEVEHYDDILGCNLHFYIPTSAKLSSLHIKCKDDCVIVQEHSGIQLGSLKITGQQVFLNMAESTVEEIDIYIDNGFVQFNNLKSGGSTNTRNIQIGHGDLIIESTESWKVDITTSSENYCVSANSVTTLTPFTSSAISPPLSNYVTQLYRQKGYFTTQWAGVVQMCTVSGCTGSEPTIKAYNFEGNIYVNVLETYPSNVQSSANVVSGSRYGQKVELPYTAQIMIENSRNLTKENSLPNLIIKFVLGNFNALSSHGKKWIFAEHSLYAILKPWWLSFFTLSRLVENTVTVNTHLSPGFCPYNHINSVEENFLVKSALVDYLNATEGGVYFLKPATQQLGTGTTETSMGFANFADIAQFSDEWVTVDAEPGQDLEYVKILLTENIEIFLLTIATITVAWILSLLLFLSISRLVFTFFKKVKEKIYHIEFYWKIYAKVSNGNRKDVILFNFEEDDTEKVQNFYINNFLIRLDFGLFQLPSTTSFVDFLINELWTNKYTSLRRFYEMAFEEVEYNKIIDLEMQNSQHDRTSLKQLKGLYQQMCFLMNYKEDDLSSTHSLSLLKSKGMVLTNSDSHRQFLIRLTLNTNGDLGLNYLKVDSKQSSLEIFLDVFCEKTNFDEDKIPLEVFIERYGQFCKLNHMEQVLIDHILLKNQFGIESRTYLKEMVERDYDQILSEPAKTSQGTIASIKTYITNIFSKKSFYHLKVDRVKNINLFLSGKLNETDVTKEEYKQIIDLAILERYWMFNDFFAVMIELLIIVALSVPFFAIFLFQEIEHSGYSLRSEDINIYGFNLNSNDIWLLHIKIFKNTLLLCVFCFVFLFWVSSFFNLINNIVRLEFPWINAFDNYKAKRNLFSTWFNVYQWCFISVSFSCILWYICVVTVWDIIASIINGQAYLATTAMAIAFIFMIYSLRNEFSKTYWQSKIRFKQHFREIWSTRIRVVVKKMVKYISERDGLTVEQQQGDIQLPQIISHEENINIVNMNLKKVASENPRNNNFIKFFFSLVHADSSLRMNLEYLLLEPPFSFNKYMTQLLCNVLFMSKSLKMDRFNIEKNIKLVASVIFNYRDDELVPLKLKDLGSKVQCNCSRNTLIVNNTCSLCKSELYQEPFVQEAIQHLRIADNSKILMHMLDILSNLQKRRPDQVIKIIEKTFLEEYSEKVFEPIKPTLDLIHFIVFNLVEDYDYVKLTQIFTEFLKKSLKVDMNLTEIMMLYLLRDNLILSSEKDQVYNYLNTTSIYKRQICTSGAYSKEKKMLVQFLSLSTSFMALEPQISDDLILELTSDINSYWRHVNYPISNTVVNFMVHFPLYFIQSQNMVTQKIAEHAENSNISRDISNLIYNFSIIANGTVSWKQDFEFHLRRNTAFNTIKNKLQLSFKELFGVIYMMKGGTSNEYVNWIMNYILRKNNLLTMRKYIDTIIVLYASSDKNKIKKALIIFKPYCTKGNKQFIELVKIFCFFKGIIIEDETTKLSFQEFYKTFPCKKTDSDDKLKDMFTNSIFTKSFSKFKTFKENMMFVNRGLKNSSHTGDSELSKLLNIIELFFEFNFGTNIPEMLNKLKEFISELEVSIVFNVALKLIKAINGFKGVTKGVYNERLKESFNALGEVMIRRPTDFEQLWILIYSSEHSVKLQALNYFVDIKRLATGVDNYRFKYHSIYIEKRVQFMRNQIKFNNKLIEYIRNPSYRFGMCIIKRIFMKGFKVSLEEIKLMLSMIIIKENPSTRKYNQVVEDVLSESELKDNAEVSENNFHESKRSSMRSAESASVHTRAKTFYSSLMEYVINQDSNQLGNYFQEEHDEPMLKNLAFCRFSRSSNEIVNKIFDQMIKNGKARLCSLHYFFYLITGLVRRNKIHMKHTLEQEINDWVGIKSELLDFIELYTDRKNSAMVDMIFKIQNRIFFNLHSDKEQQKVTGMLESILTKEFYENIELIISGEQPSLNYLSDLFKIPFKKLKFVYLLTLLKLQTKVEYVFEQFLNTQDVRKILELQAINSQELVLLLKICLNVVDYDTITDLLRMMKLDQVIIPEVLINLLLIDLRVDKKPITIKDFNKSLLVHSAIFEKLGESKEVCWALCRVLKGDFLIFSELIDVLNEDNIPQNHKYFSSILTGMIGAKNYTHYDYNLFKALSVGGLSQYHTQLSYYLNKFSKGERECSFEYAQYLLQSAQHGFKVHPLWSIMTQIFLDANIERRSVSIKKFHRIPFLKDANIMHLLVIYNIVNADEMVIEFIHDFAFFRNIFTFISTSRQQQKIEGSSNQLTLLIEEMYEFFEKEVENYSKIMKKLIMDKKIIIEFENFEKMTCPIMQGFMLDACKAAQETQYMQSTDFYPSLNKLLFQAWKQDLHKRGDSLNPKKDEKENIERLTKKIEDLFRELKLQLISPFQMFVTKENITSTEYWERTFEEVSDLEDFLNSTVDYFMRCLDQTNVMVSNYKTQTEFEEDYNEAPPSATQSIEDEVPESMQEEDLEASSTEENGQDSKSKIKRKVSAQIPSEKAGSSSEVAVQWFGLPIYVLLDRLRQYQNLGSDDKLENMDEIFFKSNILFNILEKSLFFYSAGESFRKYKYFSEFNLSNGIRMPSKSWVKYSGSLFMPDIRLYFLRLQENHSLSRANSDLSKNKVTDNDTLLLMCFIIRKVVENDRQFFCNRGIVTQFCYSPSDSYSEPQHFVEDKINLGVPRIDIKKVCMKKKMTMYEEDKQLTKEFYTLQFMAQEEYKDINDPRRIKLMEKLFSVSINELVRERDPTSLSVKLIHEGYYWNNKNERDRREEDIRSIEETFFPRYFGPNDTNTHIDTKLVYKRVEVPLMGGDFSKMKPHSLKFLNDLALGKYSVLSETKNIFTENFELATYQKIYESILHLHSARRNFDPKLLLAAFKTLSPYLSSNIYNLNSVLEFIVENNYALKGAGESNKVKLKDYYLFRELGLKNQSFFHIFLLHTYPNDIRTQYIQKIIEDLGIIDMGKIKQTIMMLLNLCYLVKSDWEASFSLEEFRILAEGILGDREDIHKEEKRKQTRLNSVGLSKDVEEDKDQDLIELIYKNVSSLGNQKIPTRNIEPFHQLFETMGQKNGYKEMFDRGLVDIFNNFILDITSKNKKVFLENFEKELEEVQPIFGVKKPYLMLVFDLIHWLTSAQPQNFSQIEQSASTLFCSDFFGGQMPPDASSYKKILEFICGFYRADIESILSFLKENDMKDEYCFVLSYYCYIYVIKGQFMNVQIDPVQTETVGKCLCFAFIHIVYQESHSPDTSHSDTEDILCLMTDRLVEAVFKVNHKQITVLFTSRLDSKKDKSPDATYGDNIDVIFKGELFKPFEREISKALTESSEMQLDNYPQLRKALAKAMNLFFCKPNYFEDDNSLSLNSKKMNRGTDSKETKRVSQLIQSAYGLRENWEATKRNFEERGQKYATNKAVKPINSLIMHAIETQTNFEFMNVTPTDNRILRNYIYTTMIFVFIYLKNIRKWVDSNDNNTKLQVIKNSLTFIWKLFIKINVEEASKNNGYQDPLSGLNLVSKDQKVAFLNKYTCMLYNLKIHKSDISILKELLAFVKHYVFSKSVLEENRREGTNLDDTYNSDVREPMMVQVDEPNQLDAKAIQKREEDVVKKLVNTLKLDNFMELYDYLEELGDGRDISENYKENIVNLFIQIMSPYDKFKKHIPDIKCIVKLMQGDYSKLDYFVDKLFSRSENASYTRSNLKNYINSYNKLAQSMQGGGEGAKSEDHIYSIPKEDRELLFKRADDGLSTASDVFLILRGRLMTNSYITFSEIELIFRRLGINLTEHRACEFLSSTKLYKAKHAVGPTKLNFSCIEEKEFENLFEYLEESVIATSKENLKISPRNLINFSLLSILLFVASIIVSSNLIIYFFGGDLLGAILCSLIPIVSMIFVSRLKVVNNIDQSSIKQEIEKGFEVITNSKPDLLV